MTSGTLLGVEPLYLAYLVAFGGAAVACFASLVPARHVGDPDSRRGLAALLLASGCWAAAQFGFLVAPGVRLKLAFYLTGLVVGFAAVGFWLYFCSAYTGRSLHRDRTYRLAAVAVFVAVVALKVTNPLHGQYFTASFVASPFPHVAIHHSLFHWLTMGLSYVLATVGYFMLFELFSQVDTDTRPLVVLFGLMGLPVVLDVAALTTPRILAIPYEPLGVAAFAVGTLFVYRDRLERIQLAGTHDEPVVVLDDDGRVRDYNREASDHFPKLVDGIGEPLEDVAPAVAAALRSEDSILTVYDDGAERYFRVSTNPFSTDGARLGELVVLTDVTDRERYRRELERQNDRLEQFASVVSHDLRNPLTVAIGRVDAVRAEYDSDHLETAAAALDRMEALVDDLLTLARQGQEATDPTPVSLAAMADRAWAMVEAGDAELVVEADATFEADADRLQQLFENLFRNAVEHGSTSPPSSPTREDAAGASSGEPSVTDVPEDAVEHGGDDVAVRVGPLDDGFYVADDGPGIPPDQRDDVFEFGYTTDDDGTGFGLAIATGVAEGHGWELSVAESWAGGARFEVHGVAMI